MGTSIWVKSGLEKPDTFNDITPGKAQIIANNLSFIQKLLLKLTGLVYLDDLNNNEYPHRAPLYLFKCNIHGFEINYPAGYDEMLTCIECLVENKLTPIDPSKYILEKIMSTK